MIKKLAKKNAFLFSISKRIYRLIKAVIYLLTFKEGAKNYFLCLLSALFRTERSLGKPMLLTIEPSNICNQRCPVCETGARILKREGKLMKFEEFRYIIEQFDKNLKKIYFYFMGEPFLNKDTYKMIRYAADRGIYVVSCTNGDYVEPEELVKCGIAEIQFQIGGITQETHQIYRIGGNLSRCLSNLQESVILKRKYWSEISKEKYPIRIGLGLIVMKHNEHQIKDFIKLAKEIGVDYYQIVLPCVRNIEQGERFLPLNRKYWIYDDKAFRNGVLKVKTPPKNYCEWIYSTVTIQVNGDVVPCCRDPFGKYVLGNVFKENIYDIWNNERYRRLRKTVATKQHRLELCAFCEGYGMPELV